MWIKAVPSLPTSKGASQIKQLNFQAAVCAPGAARSACSSSDVSFYLRTRIDTDSTGMRRQDPASGAVCAVQETRAGRG